jgi:hypothetical protein
MDPQGPRENLFARIRRKLRIMHVFNPGLLDCALCEKRAATMLEVIMREETDGVTLCQSCLELMLKKAPQTPEHRKLAHDSFNDFDEPLAQLLHPAGWIKQDPSDLPSKPTGPHAIAPP